jgi:hypothetical protein
MTRKRAGNGLEPDAAERVATAQLEADRMLASGRPLRDLVAEHLARAGDLERENTRLRRIVADRDLEIEMLREISRGTY